MDPSRNKPDAPSFIFIGRSEADDPLDAFNPEQGRFDWRADPAVLVKHPQKQPLGIDADRVIQNLIMIAVAGFTSLALVLAVSSLGQTRSRIAPLAVNDAPAPIEPAADDAQAPSPIHDSNYAAVESRPEIVDVKEPPPLPDFRPGPVVPPETRASAAGTPATTARVRSPFAWPPQQAARQGETGVSREEPVIALTISADADERVAAPRPVTAPVSAVSLSNVPMTSVAPVAVATSGTMDAAIDRAASPEQDQNAIRSVVGQYRTAFSKLDAGAAAAIWPTVDRRALDRAFSQLSEQAFAFDSCNVSVNGVQGSASCTGRVRFVPKLGRQTPQLLERQWSFTLTKSSDDWVISSVQSK